MGKLPILIALLVISCNSLSQSIKKGDFAEFEHVVGRQVGLSLKGGGCIAGKGRIISGSNEGVQIATDEWLFGNEPSTQRITASDNVVRFDRTYLRQKFDDLQGAFETNQAAYFLFCPNRVGSARVPIVITNPEFFLGMRDAMKIYSDFVNDPETLFRVPDLIERSKSQFVLGCITEFLSNGGASNNRDIVLPVLVALLKRGNIPDGNHSGIERQIRSCIISKTFAPTKPEIRAAALKELVEIASSDNLVAIRALRIFGVILDQSDFDLRPYIPTSKKTKILANLEAIPPKQFHQGRDSLRRLLLMN